MPRRHKISARTGWRETVEAQGFPYHTVELEDGTLDRYWNEQAAYQFSEDEVEALALAGTELHRMSMEALAHAFDSRPDVLARSGYSEAFIELARRSWEDDAPGLYGRLDLALRRYSRGGVFAPVMLEYNAETPTGLLECAVIQWQWLQDKFPNADQFNFIHEQLIETWPAIAPVGSSLHLVCADDSVEDEGNLRYMADVASQAGLNVTAMGISALSLGETDEGSNIMCAPDGEPVERLFKLYPWEWMASEDGFDGLVTAGIQVVEPAWRALLGSKALLPLLAEMFPDSPYLLKAWFSEEEARASGLAFVKKPILGREGKGVSLFDTLGNVSRDGGGDDLERPEAGFMWQEKAEMIETEGESGRLYAVMGVWVIGEEACGMGIREDRDAVTGNMSSFVPHFFEK